MAEALVMSTALLIINAHRALVDALRAETPIVDKRFRDAFRETDSAAVLASIDASEEHIRRQIHRVARGIANVIPAAELFA